MHGKFEVTDGTSWTSIGIPVGASSSSSRCYGLGSLALIGAYCLWGKDSLRAAAAFWAVAAAGLVGVLRPGFLRPVYVLWMALAFPIGWTVSHLLLLIVYYLVLTPIGLLMRLFGYDPLESPARSLGQVVLDAARPRRGCRPILQTISERAVGDRACFAAKTSPFSPSKGTNRMHREIKPRRSRSRLNNSPNKSPPASWRSSGTS